MSRFDWRTGVVVLGVALAVLIAMLVLANGSGGSKSEPPKPAAPTMTELEFAVWGTPGEVAAYQSVVDDYNAASEDTTVKVSSWTSSADFLADLRSGEATPDLYLLSLSDLAETMAEKRNRPLLDLVNEREIPIGDDFEREAVNAFSIGDDLQCMPYTVSPMVMYINSELVDFEAMGAEGLPVPNEERTTWDFAEFRAAAEFASRPRQKTRGVHIDPTLRGLAPFVYSGGGELFNEDADPTSLALGEDSSTDALRQTLELLRDPRLTLTSKQLAQRSALDWFKRGRLAMIPGFRNLTPQLRAVDGLEFDVMPMPSLGSARTVGDLNGICLTPGRPGRADASANFLTYLVSDEAVRRLAETGSIQPAKRTVSLTDDFMQPNLAPEHAAVFTDAVRTIELPPLMPQGAELAALVAPDIRALLLTAPDLTDLQESLRAIDEKSQSLLDPDYEPSDGSTGAPSGSPSLSPSGSATDDRKRD